MLCFPPTFYSVNPRQIPNLVCWLDSSDPSANGILPTSNASLGNWIDKSGNGANAVQSSGSQQPTFVYNVQNNLPTVRTNGNSAQKGITVPSLTLGSNITVLVAGNISGLCVEFSQDAYANNGFWIDTTGQVYINNNGVSTAIGTAGSWNSGKFQVTTFIYDGSTFALHVKTNGSPKVIYTQSASESNIQYNHALYIGGRSTNYSYGNQCDFGGILIFNTPLNAAQIMQMENYLFNKWGT